MDKHQLLVDALALWVSVTDFDDQRRSFTFGQAKVSQMSKDIRDALELDDTNITGFMLLSYLTDAFIGMNNFSLKVLLEERERVDDFVARIQQLQALLSNKALLEDVAHFQLVTRQAVRHYHADKGEVMELIEHQHSLGLLRRDALASMKKLRVDYFTHGEPEAESVKPVYNRDVFQYWNINSMLKALCNSPSGVSLNLIRTPDDLQSYFVFAIRNGGQIITLSDIQNDAHPLQKYMSRRPDRQFGERVVQNWFPYNLMNYQYDEESDHLWIEKQDLGNGIIPINQTGFSLSAIKDLGACEVVWVTMMLELIVERFWRRPVAPAQLSYTGEMVKVENALIEHVRDVGLPVVQYQGIEAPPLTVSEVAYPDETTKKSLGSSGGNHNQWLIDRYQHLVNPQLLNLLSSGDVTAYLTADAGKNAVPNVVTTKEYKRSVDNIFERSTKKYVYHNLDAAAFGTKQKLLDDRLFLARANLATEIKRLADAEYAARKDEIKQWYRERVEANAEALLALGCQDECWVQVTGDAARVSVSGQSRRSREHATLRYRFARVMDYPTYDKECLRIPNYITLSQGLIQRQSRHFCYVTGARSSWLLAFTPQTSADLAFAAGVKVEELPDVLQHWSGEQDHRGNHLLDRIDPAAWMIGNPWINDDNFTVRIWLSTRALNAIRKTPNLPQGMEIYPSYQKDWAF
jgi:hypothetical protein